MSVTMSPGELGVGQGTHEVDEAGTLKERVSAKIRGGVDEELLDHLWVSDVLSAGRQKCGNHPGDMSRGHGRSAVLPVPGEPSFAIRSQGRDAGDQLSGGRRRDPFTGGDQVGFGAPIQGRALRRVVGDPESVWVGTVYRSDGD